MKIIILVSVFLTSSCASRPEGCGILDTCVNGAPLAYDPGMSGNSAAAQAGQDAAQAASQAGQAASHQLMHHTPPPSGF